MGHPFTLETTARVPSSFSAAKMAWGQTSRALAMTSVKLPLPSEREIMLKGERWVGTCLGNERVVKRCNSLGQIRFFWEERLKRRPVTERWERSLRGMI